jgi:hypothetical protein
MSPPDTAEAIVEACSLAASDEITLGLIVTLYRVEARVLEPKYSDDIYMVRITKPEGVGDLIDEGGTFMEHGKFSFDSTEEIAIDTELEVEIIEIADVS